MAVPPVATGGGLGLNGTGVLTRTLPARGGRGTRDLARWLLAETLRVVMRAPPFIPFGPGQSGACLGMVPRP